MLYLLPNLLGDSEEHSDMLPISVDRAVSELDQLIAESEKAGRRFLKRFAFAPPKTFRDIPIHLLNEHTTPKEREELLRQVVQGQKWGLVSDCGMPCLADPGEEFVLQARERGVEVKALVGPSSILLALVLSGLGGQRFTFRGYLPKEREVRIKDLKAMEMLSRKERSVYLFIETPYRNAGLFQELIQHLEEKTWLCAATDLTLSMESVITKRVQEWKKSKLPDIDKRPTVFLLRGC
jgi:16S rRNA (cytidine1402-2'-O)-methyltransferase